MVAIDFLNKILSGDCEAEIRAKKADGLVLVYVWCHYYIACCKYFCSLDSLRLAAKRVPRRIADRIGFDQEACERDGVDGEITSAKPSVHQHRIAHPAPLPVTGQSSMVM